MTFFERELRKIVEPTYPDATFVGRACYVRLSDLNRAKIEFVTCGTMDRYDALQMTILSRRDGQVDSLRLRFNEIWDQGQSGDPSIQQREPYVWTYLGKTEWYGYQPNRKDYGDLSGAVADYLEVFQEQTQTAGQHWQQTMQQVTNVGPYQLYGPLPLIPSGWYGPRRKRGD